MLRYLEKLRDLRGDIFANAKYSFLRNLLSIQLSDGQTVLHQIYNSHSKLSSLFDRIKLINSVESKGKEKLYPAILPDNDGKNVFHLLYDEMQANQHHRKKVLDLWECMKLIIDFIIDAKYPFEIFKYSITPVVDAIVEHDDPN